MMRFLTKLMNSRKVQATEAYLSTPLPSINEQQLGISRIGAKITSKHAGLNLDHSIVQRASY